MTEQHLFPVEPVVAPLTERQAFVMGELRRAGQDGLDADEVGARLHERREKHDAGVRCQWCSQDGVGVLKALKKKGLARRRRGGSWLALSTADGGGSSSGASSAAESAQDSDFPEGF